MRTCSRHGLARPGRKRLEMVTSGHSANEPATVDALLARATDAFADRF